MTEPESWHELFPPRDEDGPNAKPPAVSAIYVRKMQPNGKFDAYPIPFAPDELYALAQVYAQWGGGLYEFIARDDNRRVTRRQTERVAGPSKPWPGVVDGDESSSPEPPAAASARPGALAPGAPGWLTAASILGPLILEYLKNQASMQQAQQQQHQMLMMTLLDRGSAAGKEHLQAMAQIYGTMPEMFSKVMTQGAGGGTSEAFFKGLETAQELMAGMKEAQGGDDLDTGTIMQTIAGFMQFMNNQGPPVPGSGVAGMPPPGVPAAPAAAPAPEAQPDPN